MSREELETKSVGELRALCKERGLQISNHTRSFKKAELIDSLCGAPEEKAEEKTEEKTAVEEKASKAEEKQRYIETAEIGSLVAFRVPGKPDKVDSAKIINRSSKRAVIKVENKQGENYVVPYEDVLWVRTGLRWPKGVYELLTKGRRKNEAKVEPNK